MAGLDVTQKAEIYHLLFQLNSAFASIVGHCEALQRVGLLKSQASKLFPSFIQELQAEINQEFLNPLHSAEQEDWAHHGKARQKWERYLKGARRKK